MRIEPVVDNQSPKQKNLEINDQYLVKSNFKAAVQNLGIVKGEKFGEMIKNAEAVQKVILDGIHENIKTEGMLDEQSDRCIVEGNETNDEFDAKIMLQ